MATTIIVAAAGDPVAYTPAQFAIDLALGVGTVLLWVGAAASAAIGLAFIFMGIRKGFKFFKSLAK